MTKIFCLGLPRTGTKTLVEALKILGYNAMHELSVAADIDHPAVQEALAEYDAFANWPWIGMIDDLIYRYWDAHYIINYIPKKPWIEDCIKTFGGYPAFIREHIFGVKYQDPTVSPDYWLDYYDGYYNGLRHTPPPNSVWMDISREGWTPICSILGIDEPDIPFPHVNKDPRGTRD
jgi:hypothetical protein